MRDAHDVLGVRRGATPDEIQAAYRRLARLHHPDAPGGDDARMRELNLAYDSLRGGAPGPRPVDPPVQGRPTVHSPVRLPSTRTVVVVLAGLAVVVAVLAAVAATGTGTLAPTTAEVVVSNRRFDVDEVRLRADAPVELRLVNRDVGYRHNLVVAVGDSLVARGEPVTGPTAVAYDVGPLPAGTYALRCEIVPSMTARLVVT